MAVGVLRFCTLRRACEDSALRFARELLLGTPVKLSVGGAETPGEDSVLVDAASPLPWSSLPRQWHCPERCFSKPLLNVPRSDLPRTPS